MQNRSVTYDVRRLLCGRDDATARTKTVINYHDVSSSSIRTCMCSAEIPMNIHVIIIIMYKPTIEKKILFKHRVSICAVQAQRLLIGINGRMSDCTTPVGMSYGARC